MLIAITGDTHMPRGSRRLPDAAVERLGEADLVIHTGDFVGTEALEIFEGLDAPVRAVRGNMDKPEIAGDLPEQLSFEAEGRMIGLIHDPGPRKNRLERLRDRFPDCEAVVFGHTHEPQHERDGDFQIFNPGSPTEHRGRWHTHTMGLARVSEAGIEFELVEVR